MEADWDRVNQAIGFINASMFRPALLDLNLENANPDYGGNVGLFTAENHKQYGTFTVLCLGYYNSMSAEAWRVEARSQLDDAQRAVFDNAIHDSYYGGADGGIKCYCGASAEVEFAEGVTMCAGCAGALIGAALEDEQTVAEFMLKEVA